MSCHVNVGLARSVLQTQFWRPLKDGKPSCFFITDLSNQCNRRTYLPTGVRNANKRGKEVAKQTTVDQTWFLWIIGHLLLTSRENKCHFWALLFLFRHRSLSVEAVLLHNLAVAPATHQSGSGELHGCSKEINRDCVWVFSGRNVWHCFLLIFGNEGGACILKNNSGGFVFDYFDSKRWRMPVLLHEHIAAEFLDKPKHSL